MPPKSHTNLTTRKLLATMRASVSDIREIIRRMEMVIEQIRIMVREFDDHWPTSAAAWTRAEIQSEHGVGLVRSVAGSDNVRI